MKEVEKKKTPRALFLNDVLKDVVTKEIEDKGEDFVNQNEFITKIISETIRNIGNESKKEAQIFFSGHNGYLSEMISEIDDVLCGDSESSYSRNLKKQMKGLKTPLYRINCRLERGEYWWHIGAFTPIKLWEDSKQFEYFDNLVPLIYESLKSFSPSADASYTNDLKESEVIMKYFYSRLINSNDPNLDISNFKKLFNKHGACCGRLDRPVLAVLKSIQEQKETEKRNGDDEHALKQIPSVFPIISWYPTKTSFCFLSVWDPFNKLKAVDEVEVSAQLGELTIIVFERDRSISYDDVHFNTGMKLFFEKAIKRIFYSVKYHTDNNELNEMITERANISSHLYGDEGLGKLLQSDKEAGAFSEEKTTDTLSKLVKEVLCSQVSNVDTFPVFPFDRALIGPEPMASIKSSKYNLKWIETAMLSNQSEDKQSYFTSDMRIFSNKTLKQMNASKKRPLKDLELSAYELKSWKCTTDYDSPDINTVFKLVEMITEEKYYTKFRPLPLYALYLLHLGDEATEVEGFSPEYAEGYVENRREIAEELLRHMDEDGFIFDYDYNVNFEGEEQYDTVQHLLACLFEFLNPSNSIFSDNNLRLGKFLDDNTWLKSTVALLNKRKIKKEKNSYINKDTVKINNTSENDTKELEYILGKGLKSFHSLDYLDKREQRKYTNRKEAMDKVFSCTTVEEIAKNRSSYIFACYCPESGLNKEEILKEKGFAFLLMADQDYSKDLVDIRYQMEDLKRLLKMLIRNIRNNSEEQNRIIKKQSAVLISSVGQVIHSIASKNFNLDDELSENFASVEDLKKMLYEKNKRMKEDAGGFKSSLESLRRFLEKKTDPEEIEIEASGKNLIELFEKNEGQKSERIKSLKDYLQIKIDDRWKIISGRGPSPELVLDKSFLIKSVIYLDRSILLEVIQAALNNAVDESAIIDSDDKKIIVVRFHNFSKTYDGENRSDWPWFFCIDISNSAQKHIPGERLELLNAADPKSVGKNTDKKLSSGQGVMYSRWLLQERIGYGSDLKIFNHETKNGDPCVITRIMFPSKQSAIKYNVEPLNLEYQGSLDNYILYVEDNKSIYKRELKKIKLLANEFMLEVIHTDELSEALALINKKVPHMLIADRSIYKNKGDGFLEEKYGLSLMSHYLKITDVPRLIVVSGQSEDSVVSAEFNRIMPDWEKFKVDKINTESVTEGKGIIYFNTEGNGKNLNSKELHLILSSIIRAPRKSINITKFDLQDKKPIIIGPFIDPDIKVIQKRIREENSGLINNKGLLCIQVSNSKEWNRVIQAWISNKLFIKDDLENEISCSDNTYNNLLYLVLTTPDKKIADIIKHFNFIYQTHTNNILHWPHSEFPGEDDQLVNSYLFYRKVIPTDSAGFIRRLRHDVKNRYGLSSMEWANSIKDKTEGIVDILQNGWQLTSENIAEVIDGNYNTEELLIQNRSLKLLSNGNDSVNSLAIHPLTFLENTIVHIESNKEKDDDALYNMLAAYIDYLKNWSVDNDKK